MTIYEFPVKYPRSQILLPPPPPGGDHIRKIKVAGLPGHRFIEKIQNCGHSFTRDWLECLGWRRSFSNFIGSLHFFGSNWGQSYRQRWSVTDNLHILASDQKKIVFRATFEQLSLPKQLLIVLWATFSRKTGILSIFNDWINILHLV